MRLGRRDEGASLDRAFASHSAQNDAAVVHFLNRATFGVRAGDIDEVRRIGIAAFLDRQLHPEQIDDAALQARLAAFETLNLTSKEIAEQYYLPAAEARRRRQVLQAANGPRPSPQPQMQEVLVDFWFNHFNVFAGKGADRGLLTAYERDLIRPRIFGRFRDLLGATAESPAMLFFLDNWMSVDPSGPHLAVAGTDMSRLRPRRAAVTATRPAGRPPLMRAPAAPRKPARGFNENYARELMELHTLGVDGGYTQRDVVEVARCFTGWTIAQPRDGGDFRFDARQHDPGQKVVLGHVIKPGGGKSDGDQVLDILARDPHTARFIATKLVRRFVADDPPPALVDRVAKRFRETDGDLREVYRAIFLSPEFWSEQAQVAKTKTPFESVASALRASRAQVEDAASTVRALRALGMPLYYCQPPTGYAGRADAWVNTGALLNRMNFALALVDNRLPGVHVDLSALASTADLAAARSQLLRALLDNNASASTRAVLDRAATVPQLVALALGSPEFQKR